MTHAELYEIVKDHRDVWGQHFAITVCHDGSVEFVRHFTNEAGEPEHVEAELLGLGVAWLSRNGATPHLHGNTTNSKCRIDYTVTDKDDTEDFYFKYADSPTAAVYAAIGAVKAARRGSA